MIIIKKSRCVFVNDIPFSKWSRSSTHRKYKLDERKRKKCMPSDVLCGVDTVLVPGLFALPFSTHLLSLFLSIAQNIGHNFHFCHKFIHAIQPCTHTYAPIRKMHILYGYWHSQNCVRMSCYATMNVWQQQQQQK